MLPKGQAYERWVYRIVPMLINLLEIDLKLPTVALREFVTGLYGRHEVDILLRTDDAMVLVECKDHRILKSSEVKMAYLKFIEIAKAHPEVVVSGIIISSSGFADPDRVWVDRAREIITTPDNVTLPVRLLNLRPVAIVGTSMIYEYENAALVIRLLTNSPTPTPADKEAILSMGDMSQRLAACLDVIRGTTSREQELFAHVEAATDLLHFGLAHDAHHFAVRAIAIGKTQNDSDAIQAAQNIEAMAAYQAALVGGRSKKRPGARHLYRLSSETRFLESARAASALSFIGAWQGMYADPQDALVTLQSAKLQATRSDGQDAAYHSFMADFRLAEIFTGDRRDEHLASAANWLPNLQVRNAEVAKILINRLRSGLDCSIASTFDESVAIKHEI